MSIADVLAIHVWSAKRMARFSDYPLNSQLNSKHLAGESKKLQTLFKMFLENEKSQGIDKQQLGIRRTEIKMNTIFMQK